MQTQVGKAFTDYSASSMVGGMNSMIERIVPALVLTPTSIRLEAARVTGILEKTTKKRGFATFKDA